MGWGGSVRVMLAGGLGEGSSGRVEFYVEWVRWRNDYVADGSKG